MTSRHCRYCDPPQTLAQQIVSEVLSQKTGTAEDIRYTVSLVECLIDNNDRGVSLRVFVCMAVVFGLGMMVGILH